ncbi:MAG: hypothetical protein QM698_11520 [Micropepsaceae bacterium]
MPDPDVPRYRLSKIANVLGMSPNIVHNWLNSPQRVFALSDEDEAAVGSGGNHRFTFESALRIGILRACSEHGLPPSKGVNVVMSYMETGSDTHWNGKRYRRAPGQDFKGGVQTVLVLSKAYSPHGFTIIPCATDDSWVSLIGVHMLGAAVINLTALRNALREYLDAPTSEDRQT